MVSFCSSEMVIMDVDSWKYMFEQICERLGTTHMHKVLMSQVMLIFKITCLGTGVKKMAV